MNMTVKKLWQAFKLSGKGYKGWTKNGLRFYLFDGIYEEFKKLIKKVDKVYEEII